MKIDATHARAIRGFLITVSVQAADSQVIQQVTTTLDGQQLGSDSPSAESYNRSFNQVGFAGPGESHTLTVVAVDDQADEHRSVSNWVDQV